MINILGRGTEFANTEASYKDTIHTYIDMYVDTQDEYTEAANIPIYCMRWTRQSITNYAN